jgi:hypothetical protein
MRPRRLHRRDRLIGDVCSLGEVGSIARPAHQRRRVPQEVGAVASSAHQRCRVPQKVGSVARRSVISDVEPLSEVGSIEKVGPVGDSFDEQRALVHGLGRARLTSHDGGIAATEC